MFSSRKNTEEFFAVYNINSSSISGAHIKKGSTVEQNKIITNWDHNNIFLYEDIDIDRFIENTKNNLEKTITNIYQYHHPKPTLVEVVLGAPWYSIETHDISYQKDTPFTCTKKLIENLIEKEIENDSLEKSKKNNLFGQEYTIVEKRFSKIKLNGYSTESPFGKKASTIVFSFTLVTMPKIAYDSFVGVFRKFYGNKKINFITKSFTTYNIFKEVNNCMIVDVSEEITDVSFIKNHIVESSYTFPLGYLGLYKTLSNTQTLTLEETIAIMESYRLDKLIGAPKKRAEESIVNFSEAWQRGLQELLESREQGFCLPSKIIITSDERFKTILTETISKDPFVEYSCAYQKPEIHFLDISYIQKPPLYFTELKPDISIIVSTLFVN